MDSRYAYAVGYVRALENKLLSGHIFQQLVNAGKTAAFYKILESTPYSGAVADEFIQMLEEESIELSRFVKKLLIENVLREIAGLAYDFYNLSAILSANSINPDSTPFLYRKRGNINADELRKRLTEKRYRQLPDYMAEAARKAEKTAAEFDDPAFAAITAEKEYFYALDVKCAASKNSFFRDYSAAAADIYNFKTFFRIRRLGANAKTLEASLTDAGGLKSGVFTAWFKNTADAVPVEVTGTRYAHIAETGEACLNQNHSLSRVDAAAEKLLFEILSKTSMVVMGPEPVFAYGLRKENEIKKLRIISAGIQSGAGPEAISERIHLPS